MGGTRGTYGWDKMAWAGHVAHMGGIKHVVVGKSDKKTLLGRPKCREAENVKIYVRETYGRV